jgi:UPF0716 protein FxsA
MPLFRLLIILLLTVPLLELTLLIKVGSVLGVLPTILLCIFTAVLGAALIRVQGLQTLQRVQRKLDQREIPAVDLVAGLILLISGVLLLTPGFFTDILGFLCLVPRLRETLARKVIGHLIANSERGPHNHTVIVEGEFWKEDDARKKLHH